MRINAISNYRSNSTSSNFNKNNYQSSVTKQNSTLPSDKFTSSKVSFGYGPWKYWEIHVLERDSDGLRDLGEYFHKETLATIKEVADLSIGEFKKESFYRLNKAVEEVKTYKNKLQQELNGNCSAARRNDLTEEIQRLDDKANSVYQVMRDNETRSPRDNNPFSWENIQYG